MKVLEKLIFVVKSKYYLSNSCLEWGMFKSFLLNCIIWWQNLIYLYEILFFNACCWLYKFFNLILLVLPHPMWTQFKYVWIKEKYNFSNDLKSKNFFALNNTPRFFDVFLHYGNLLFSCYIIINLNSKKFRWGYLFNFKSVKRK